MYYSSHSSLDPGEIIVEIVVESEKCWYLLLVHSLSVGGEVVGIVGVMVMCWRMVLVSSELAAEAVLAV